VSTSFQLCRFMADPALVSPGFLEPVTAPRVVSAVYGNGSLLSGSAWSIDKTTGLLSFSTPPAAGAVIAAHFTFRPRCPFTDDLTDFEEFMYLLHKVGGLKFVSAIGDRTGAPI